MLETRSTQSSPRRRTQLGVASLVSFAVALWSARAGVTALMEGLNVVYRETDTRSLVLLQYPDLARADLRADRRAPSSRCSRVVAVPAVLALQRPRRARRRSSPAGCRSLILGVAVVFVIGALYRYGPHRALARKRWVTVGAVVATLGWLRGIARACRSTSRASRTSTSTYGSLGAIVGLLFWLYASAFVVLLGAELNAELELQTERDTTTGRPRPMGERGAYVADHVA